MLTRTWHVHDHHQDREVCSCLQTPPEIRLCLETSYTPVENFFCHSVQAAQCAEAAAGPVVFPRRYQLHKPEALDPETELPAVIHVYAKPNLKAKVLAHIPADPLAWSKQMFLVTVTELVENKKLMWARLGNPWLFTTKAAWVLAADLAGETPQFFMTALCPLDSLRPSVDFTRLSQANQPRPLDPPTMTTPTPPPTPGSRLRPQRKVSLAWQGLGCGDMTATVDYIGDEGSPVLTVDNLLRDPLAVRRHFIQHVTLRQPKGHAGFPGATGTIPTWYFELYTQCLRGIVKEVMGMDIAGLRPGGDPRKRCLRTAPTAAGGTPQHRPSLHRAYRKFRRPVPAQATSGFIGLPLCKKAPKNWADKVESDGSYCQMTHFDSGFQDTFSEGIASVHLLTLDEDCLDGGVTADGDRCRRWPSGRPATAFYRDRASGTERVRAANTYPTYISNRFAAKHMARSIKKKLRRKAFTASGNEYEELLHLSTVKLNRVTLYPVGQDPALKSRVEKRVVCVCVWMGGVEGFCPGGVLHTGLLTCLVLPAKVVALGWR